jgi:hypothetical protein
MGDEMKFFIFIITLLLIPIVLAGTPHTIWGYVSSDGSTVTAYIEDRESEILTDIVGVQGNSKTENSWLIDTGNFPSEWFNDEKLIIKIDDIETNIILNSEVGNQQADDINLGTTEIKVMEDEKISENSVGKTNTGSSGSSRSSTIGDTQKIDEVIEKSTTNEELAEVITITREEIELEEEETASVKAQSKKTIVVQKDGPKPYYWVPILILIAVIVYMFWRKRK